MQDNQDINIRRVIKDCEQSQISTFILAIEKSGLYTRKSYVGVNDKCHLERFNYVCGNDKISLVYDTVAKVLSFTAQKNIVQGLETIFFNSSGNKRNTVTTITERAAASSNNNIDKNKNEVRLKSESDKKSAFPGLPQHLNKPQAGGTVRLKVNVDDGTNAKNKTTVASVKIELKEHDKTIIEKPNTDKLKQPLKVEYDKKTTVRTETKKKIAKVETEKNNIEQKTIEYKNGFADKNYSTTQFSELYKKLCGGRNTAVSVSKVDKKGTSEEMTTYIVSGLENEKVIMRYMPIKKSLALQGKDTPLYAFIQTMMTYGVNFNRTDVKVSSSATLAKKDNQQAAKSVSPTKAVKPIVEKSNDPKETVTKSKAVTNRKNKNAVKNEVAQELSDEIKITAPKPRVAAAVKVVDKAEKPRKISASEKKLQKLMPNAFEFLSPQSLQYFESGYKDLTNKRNKLSDYSVLLVSPFKGLERLIYGLQMAESISVKMIGQAFDKTDTGEYCLKSGYQKKIDSIVFNEVMSSLYTVYCKERNFYSHSDNSQESSVREIKDQKDALDKLVEIIDVMDYNCKKLREIGFSIDSSK